MSETATGGKTLRTALGMQLIQTVNGQWRPKNNFTLCCDCFIKKSLLLCSYIYIYDLKITQNVFQDNAEIMSIDKLNNYIHKINK